MENRFEERFKRKVHRGKFGSIGAGIFLLGIGSLLLARELGVLFPSWFFSWPVLLIGIGLFIGFRLGFRRGPWLFPLLIGTILLLDRIYPEIHLKPFIWPVIFIVLGLLFIFRPKSQRCRNWESKQKLPERNEPAQDQNESWVGADQAHTDRRDFIDITTVFSGSKKIILTKSFKGGDIVNFMGGSEVDMSQSDFNGTITIDTTNIFGGTKLIIPSNWDVQSEVVAIFGGVDDKRQVNGHGPDPNKLVVIEGTCIFGGIEIRNY
jgi:predicted membrane protein